MSKKTTLPTIEEDTEKEECSVFPFPEGSILYDCTEDCDSISLYGVVTLGSERMGVIWEYGWSDDMQNNLTYSCPVYVGSACVAITVLDRYLLGKKFPVKQSDGTYKLTSECDR